MVSDGQSTGLSRANIVVTIVSTLTGLVLGYLTLAATVKWPPFQEAPVTSVQVFKATSAQGQPNCAITSCAFIGVELRAFEPDAEVRCTFDSSVGADDFVAYVGRTDTDGFLRGESRNYFGDAGGWVTVRCFGKAGRAEGELDPW
jgi:hypothetical protein